MSHTMYTEHRNAKTIDIDTWPTAHVLQAIIDEDAAAVAAAREAVPALADAVEAAAQQLGRGGHIHYFGAGASGRLALLDAMEIRPTFGTPADWFTAHFPGGGSALLDSTKDFEDDASSGAADASELRPDDLAVGITASGRTPYVLGALRQACRLGVPTVLVTSNPDPRLRDTAGIVVVADTGPEALTGSTRLKAGTATKVLLNAFSTALMVRVGRTYSNLMVGLIATNDKLFSRAVTVLEMATGLPRPTCDSALRQCNDDLPTALVHLLTGATPAGSAGALHEAGTVRAALSLLQQ